jgi:hypothetical protein
MLHSQPHAQQLDARNQAIKLNALPEQGNCSTSCLWPNQMLPLFLNPLLEFIGEDLRPRMRNNAPVHPGKAARSVRGNRAGDGLTDRIMRHSQWKWGVADRPDRRSTAPVLEPREERKNIGWDPSARDSRSGILALTSWRIFRPIPLSAIALCSKQLSFLGTFEAWIVQPIRTACNPPPEAAHDGGSQDD